MEQLKGSGAEILICTKSDLVVRDIDLLKELERLLFPWSINTLDESFKNDMDNAVSIERRLKAMKQVMMRVSAPSVLWRRFFQALRILKPFLNG